MCLNIHDVVEGYRLTPVEIRCGFCKQVHHTMARPLTHTNAHPEEDVHTVVDTSAHTEVFLSEVKESVLN